MMRGSIYGEYMAGILRKFLEELITKIKCDSIQKKDKSSSKACELLATKEKNLTIKKLEFIVNSYDNEMQLDTELKSFLVWRWNLIKQSPLSYTARPNSHINQICLEIAKMLYQLNDDNNEKKIYQYLMPTIINTFDSTLYFCKESIDDYSLNEIILTDDFSALIPASLITLLSPKRIDFKDIEAPYVNKRGNLSKKLSSNEIKKLVNHSHESRQLYMLYKHLIDIKNSSISVGGEINRLIAALNRGGEHGGHGGNSLSEGVDASIGIITFMNYWNCLEQQEKIKIGVFKASEHGKSLADILDIFTNKESKGFKCVEINASILSDILMAHPELYNMGKNNSDYPVFLENLFNHCKKKLNESIDGVEKGVWTKAIFEQFMLNEKSSIYDVMDMIFMQDYHGTIHSVAYFNRYLKNLSSKGGNLLLFDEDGNTPLLWAIKHGLTECFQSIMACSMTDETLLLHCDAEGFSMLMLAAIENDIESITTIINNKFFTKKMLKHQDGYGNTALIWAAYDGHVDIVNALLSSKVFDSDMLLQCDKDGNNALHWAVKKGHISIVSALLQSPHYDKNMLTQQNKLGDTPLDIAADNSQQEIAIILQEKHLVTCSM
jgi:ankyrin repeat protein